MADSSGLRGRVFAALTGNNQADVSGKGDDVTGMLMAIGGPSSRTRSGIDLTQAAGSLGVSRRTVERWVKSAATGTGQRPSPTHSKALTGKARQAASTKAGRKAALSGVRAAKTFARGARISINGMQGPHAAGRDYLRERTTQLELDPEAVEAMLDAYEQGGEKAFTAWATNHWGVDGGDGAPAYLDDWRFESMNSVDLEGPYGGGWR